MKIAVVITSKIFERNYLNNIFFDGEYTGDFVILKRHELPEHKDLRMPQIFYRLSSKQDLLSRIIFKIELLRKLNRSKTFKFRLARALHWPEIKLLLGIASEKDYRPRLNDLFELIKLVIKFSVSTLSHIALLPLILAPQGIFSLLFRASGGELAEKLAKSCPDIVIFPFTGYEVEQNYLPGIARRIGAKLVFCTDNWDNLSSKTVISFKPDLITVWGEQTKRHAIEIQGIPSERVFIAPSPRLAIYKNSMPVIAKQFVIGFVGAFLSFDEIEALEILEGILDKRFEERGESWSIYYRPHPWRMAKSNIKRLSLLKRVSLPEEFRNIYTNNAWNTDFQPALEGYPKYFAKCDFIVGGLTTMLLEALLAKRRVIGIGYWDKSYNLYSPGSALQNYEHFNEIRQLENIRIAKSKAEFKKLIMLELNLSKFIDINDERSIVDIDAVLTLSKLAVKLKFSQ